MDGQSVMRVARLLRLGKGISSPEMAQVRGDLTPAEWPKVLKAARVVVQARGLLPSANAQQTLAEMFRSLGWDIYAEGMAPSGGDRFTVRVPVRIDFPDRPSEWKTIRDTFGAGTTWEQVISKLQSLGAAMAKKYGAEDFEISWDSLNSF